MTVGITLTNGIESVMIADSRETSGQRESDRAKKIALFNSTGYSGAICAAGQANYIESIFKKINDYRIDALVDFSKIISDDVLTEMKSQVYSRAKPLVDDTYLKASWIANKSEKDKFLKQNISRVMSDYDAELRRASNLSFLISGFDNEKNKIKTLLANPGNNLEIHDVHYEIGSGTDGSNLYLNEKLQGIAPQNLSFDELLFFAINAYSKSNINRGVGGTPTIALISKDNTSLLSDENVIALGNISGAYLSEFNSKKINRDFFMVALGDMRANRLDYDKVAHALKLTPYATNSMYIPFNSWQETTNRTMFAKK